MENVYGYQLLLMEKTKLVTINDSYDFWLLIMVKRSNKIFILQSNQLDVDISLCWDVQYWHF